MAFASLSGALTTKFLASPVASSVPGSPLLEDAFEGTDLPYVILRDVVQEETFADMEGGFWVEGSWRFEVFATSKDTAETLAGEIREAFPSNTTLTLTGFTTIRMLPARFACALDQTRSTDVKRVYLATWEYEGLFLRR